MPRYVLPVEAWDVPKSVWNATCRAVFAPLTNRGLVPRLKSIAATAARRPLARRLGTEFQLVGTKPDAARRPNDEAVDGISLIDRIVRTALDESARPIMLLIRATNVLVVPVHHGRREQRAFLKLPLSPPGTVAQERNWRSIELLYRRYPDAISAPRPLARGELEGQPYFIESALLGTAGSRLRADRSRLVALACDLITRLHVQTRTDTPAAAKRTWHERVAAMRRRPSVGSCSGFEELAGAFLDRIRDVPFSVFSHNDYYLENVIFADPDEPSGILDWDSADPQGLPGPDVLHLLSSAAMQQHGLTRRRVLERWLAGQLLEARAPFDHYLRGLKLPNRIATWLIIYCLVEMWRLTVQEDYFPASSQFRQNIENVMHDLCEVGLDATRHIDS